MKMLYINNVHPLLHITEKVIKFEAWTRFEGALTLRLILIWDLTVVDF